MTETEAFEIIRRSVPGWWFDGMQAGDGAPVLGSLAAVLSRVSSAVLRASDELLPGRARYGSTASGTLRIERSGSAAGGLGVGSILAAPSGERIVLLEAASWPAGDTDPIVVQAASADRSWQANLPAGTVLAVRTPIPAPLWDQTIRAVVVSMAGGRSPDLDARAADRGLRPQPGESEVSVRSRIRTLPDGITPPAIRAILARLLPGAELVEAFRLAAYSDGAWYTDGSGDPTAPDAQGRIYEATGQAAFLISIPPSAAVGWMDADYSYSDYTDSYSRRPLMAPDGSGGEYDAGDPGIRWDIAAAAAAVELARAGGVRWWMEGV